MPALLNPKHELFAQCRSEGKTADESYVLAGYSANRGNAARLNAKEHILTRVRELTDRRAKMVDVTLESMTERINEAIAKASGDGAHPAVAANLFNLAKLHGLIIDKAKVEQGRLDEMTDDALADHIEERLAGLAERRVEGSGEGDRGAGSPGAAQSDPELQPVSEAEGVSSKRD